MVCSCLQAAFYHGRRRGQTKSRISAEDNEDDEERSQSSYHRGGNSNDSNYTPLGRHEFDDVDDSDREGGRGKHQGSKVIYASTHTH